MGAWSAEPFGNDTAVDWAWGLDDEDDWNRVRAALEDGAAHAADDEDAGCIAIAAAEVIARALGSPTQSDAYTEEVTAFVARVTPPPAELVLLARRALAVAAASGSALAELWDADATWSAATARIAAGLGS